MKEIFLIVLSLLLSAGLSLLITFLVISYAEIKKDPEIRQAEGLLAEVRALIESEAFPLHLKELYLERLPSRALRTELEEALKELNILVHDNEKGTFSFYLQPLNHYFVHQLGVRRFSRGYSS